MLSMHKRVWCFTPLFAQLVSQMACLRGHVVLFNTLCSDAQPNHQLKLPFPKNMSMDRNGPPHIQVHEIRAV